MPSHSTPRERASADPVRLLAVLVALSLAGCASDKPIQKAGAKRASEARRDAKGDPNSKDKPRLFVGPRFVTLDPELPEAAAIGVDGDGRITKLFVEVPPDDGAFERVTLPGVLAVPGLHDAHAHLLGIGEARESVDLLGAVSTDDLRARVQAFLAAHPEVPFVRGRGWDQSRFPQRRFPTAKDLEGLTDKPIFLERVDGHAVVVSRALLDKAGIGKDTEDPAGGKIVRDAQGEPTGVLVDNAIDLASTVLPAPTLADLERWLSTGMEACADAGLVAVHDMGVPVRALEALHKLDQEGRVPIRVFVYLDGSDPAALDATARYAFSERVEVKGIKLFADGAMGSRGAALLEPYSDDAGNEGLLLTEPKILEERVRQAHQRGLQAAIHAIGDRGNRVALEAIAGAEGGDRSVRHRIEHAQLVHPDDFAGFHKLGVIASMQPTHATSDMRWASARVGDARLVGAYAWKRMLISGVPLAFGSDAPVESERPSWGLYAALTRQDHEQQPEGGWRPEERLSLTEALAAFSQGAAFAVGREGDLGRLSEGMRFDVSAFDRDARADPKEWLRAEATATIIGGSLRAP